MLLNKVRRIIENNQIEEVLRTPNRVYYEIHIRDNTYVVILRKFMASCTCKYYIFQYGRKDCSHVAAAKYMENKVKA